MERDLTYHTIGEYWIAGLVIGILVLIAVFALIRFLGSVRGGKLEIDHLQISVSSRNTPKILCLFFCSNYNF